MTTPGLDCEQTALGHPGSHQAGHLGGALGCGTDQTGTLGRLSHAMAYSPPASTPLLVHSFALEAVYARCSLALGSLRSVPLSCHPGALSSTADVSNWSVAGLN